MSRSTPPSTPPAARPRGWGRCRPPGCPCRRAAADAGLDRLLAAPDLQFARAGEELAAAGRIGTPSDVFFLDLAEARAGLGGADLHGPVAARRREYERELRRRHIPRILLSDGTDAGAAAAAASAADRALPPGTLRGAPASAGTVTGTARVVLDPATARLEPGEVLVAPSTDPGWTPLLLTAAALVMETGGPISHGAAGTVVVHPGGSAAA